MKLSVLVRQRSPFLSWKEKKRIGILEVLQLSLFITQHHGADLGLLGTEVKKSSVNVRIDLIKGKRGTFKKLSEWYSVHDQ